MKLLLLQVLVITVFEANCRVYNAGEFQQLGRSIPPNAGPDRALKPDFIPELQKETENTHAIDSEYKEVNGQTKFKLRGNADKKAIKNILKELKDVIEPKQVSIEEIGTNNSAKMDTLEEMGTKNGAKMDSLEEIGTKNGERMDSLEELGTKNGAKMDLLENANEIENTKLDLIIKELETLKGFRECLPGDKWVKNNGNCFYFSTESTNWNTARDNCKKLGDSIDLAELGNPYNSRSDKWLMETLMKQGATWLGGHSPKQQQGQFIWAHSGQTLPINFPYWPSSGGEPNGHLANEWCVCSWSEENNHRTLNDYPCSNAAYYVCQQF